MTLFARRAGPPEAAGYSIVDQQLVIRGEIDTEGTIRVDGRLEGRVHRADTLIVGANGTVIGDIEAREIVIGGTVEGNLIADGRIEVLPTASVRGDIRTAAMLLHEGGTLHGSVAVDRREGNAVEGRRLELAQGQKRPTTKVSG
jgi:cytoskeletal protein CcmA (bactofilin family)